MLSMYISEMVRTIPKRLILQVMTISLRWDIEIIVEASPPDVEIVSLEGVEFVDQEVGRMMNDILFNNFKEASIREKLLNWQSLLIAQESISLRDNRILHFPRLVVAVPLHHCSAFSLTDFIKLSTLLDDHFKEEGQVELQFAMEILSSLVPNGPIGNSGSCRALSAL
ncbi:hypothetical protein Tco_0610343 [Tanacetum coccineum]